LTEHRIARIAAITIGGVFVILSILLPTTFWIMREHGGDGVSAIFKPGFGSLSEALGAALTTTGILSSIIVAVAILPFERQRSQTTKLLGIVTLALVSCEILYSLYLSLIRPLTGTVPDLLQVYLMVGLMPLGLAFTMFTIAAVV